MSYLQKISILIRQSMSPFGNVHRLNRGSSAPHQCVIIHTMPTLCNHLSNRNMVGKSGVFCHAGSKLVSLLFLLLLIPPKVEQKCKGNDQPFCLRVVQKQKEAVYIFKSPALKVLCVGDFDLLLWKAYEYNSTIKYGRKTKKQNLKLEYKCYLFFFTLQSRCFSIYYIVIVHTTNDWLVGWNKH